MASELTALDAEDILRGQNIVESASLRNVIEDHAMKRVRAELQREGYEEIEDVSNFESYDFRARKGRAIRKIEVKGTRTIGEAILFSRNEVTLAEAERVELYVVQEIEVTEKNGNIKARGGTIRKIENWGRRNFAKAALSWQVQIA
jgi:hypothetical protein